MRYSTFFYLTLLLIFYSYSVLFHSILFCSAFGLHTSELLSTCACVCAWSVCSACVQVNMNVSGTPPHHTPTPPRHDHVQCLCEQVNMKVIGTPPRPTPVRTDQSKCVCVCADEWKIVGQNLCAQTRQFCVRRWVPYRQTVMVRF